MPPPPLKNGAGGILFSGLSVCDWVREWVRAWVRESVSPTLWTPYLKNQWREFHPILVTDVIRFVHVMIRFLDQKVKGQGHSRQWPENRVKPCEHHISKTKLREFRPILATDVLRFVHVMIRLWDQKVKGQGHSRQWPKNLWTSFLNK